MRANLGAILARVPGVEENGQTTGLMSVEPAEEVRFAPARGRKLSLAHGPLVSGTAALTTASGAAYVLAVDYLEVADGGIENLAIPEGARLDISYFYHSAPSLREAGALAPVAEKSGSPAGAVGATFSTLYKMGA